MANKSINQLPNDTSVTATDKFAIQESGGTTKNVTGQMIKDFTNAGLGANNLSSVLAAGNTTGNNDIIVQNNKSIKDTSGVNKITFSDSDIAISAQDEDGNQSNNSIAGSFIDFGNNAINYSAGFGSYIVSNGPGADTAVCYMSTNVTNDGVRGSNLEVIYNYAHLDVGVTNEDFSFNAKEGLEIDPEGNNNGTRLYSEDLNTGAFSTVSIGYNQGVSLSSDDTNTGATLNVTPKNISFIPGAGTSKILYSNNLITNVGTPGTNTILTLPFGSFGVLLADVFVKVTGHNTSGSKVYFAELKSSFKSVSGTITRIGTEDRTEKSDGFTGTTTSATSISGSNVLITVTPEDTANVLWSVYVELLR